jgi:hypothetical protein
VVLLVVNREAILAGWTCPLLRDAEWVATKAKTRSITDWGSLDGATPGAAVERFLAAS